MNTDKSNSKFKSDLGNKKKWMPNWHPRYNLESGLSDYKNYLDR